MSKTGRNEPCPCGSGKKYKYCCLGKDNIISFPGTQSNHKHEDVLSKYKQFAESWQGPCPVPTFMEWRGTTNAATDVIKNEISEITDHVFESEEDLRTFILNRFDTTNNKTVDDFLGLSPDIMQKILYTKPQDNSAIFRLAPGITENDIPKIPIMEQCLFLLEAVKETGPLKATKLGNFPRNFVMFIYASVYEKYDEYPRTPKKEDDFILLSVHKYLLISAGLLKKYKGQFTITKKAEKILNENSFTKLYTLLFFTYTDKYNWAYADRYSALRIIQQSMIFGLYILQKTAQDYIESVCISDTFYNAFPAAVKEIPPGRTSAPMVIINAFRLRFLERFCEPFGLVERKTGNPDRIRNDSLYKVSDYFKRFIKLNFD